MPKYYQPKKNNPYILQDKALYKQVFWLIMRYPALIEQRQQIIHDSPPPPDGLPNGKGRVGDPTQRKALLLAEISGQLEAIDQTIAELSVKYEKTCVGDRFDPYKAFVDFGTFSYYRSKPGKDAGPCYRTFNRYRSEFVFKVAKKLNYF